MGLTWQLINSPPSRREVKSSLSLTRYTEHREQRRQKGQVIDPAICRKRFAAQHIRMLKLSPKDEDGPRRAPSSFTVNKFAVNMLYLHALDTTYT